MLGCLMIFKTFLNDKAAYIHYRYEKNGKCSVVIQAKT